MGGGVCVQLGLLQGGHLARQYGTEAQSLRPLTTLTKVDFRKKCSYQYTVPALVFSRAKLNFAGKTVPVP